MTTTTTPMTAITKMMNKKEMQREYSKQYYQANKEKIKEHSRQHYQANRDKLREYYRQYMKQYYQSNKEKIREYGRQWDRANVKRRVMIQYRYRQKVQDASGTKPCECGCGELIPAINRRLEPARFKRWHSSGGRRKK